MEAPPNALAANCQVVYNDTLFTYGSTFHALPLVPGSDSGQWQDLPVNVAVTNPSCLVISDILWIIGGRTGAAYSGIQKYSFLSKVWQNMTLSDSFIYNTSGHSSTFLADKAAILVYGGDPASSSAFMVDVADGHLTALPSSAAPPLSWPILVANSSTALLVAPSKNIYAFDNNDWRGLDITPPKADKGLLVNGTLRLFDMESDPTSVHSLDMATGKETDETSNPLNSQTSFGLTQWGDRAILTSDRDNTLSFYDLKNSTWLNSKALFALPSSTTTSLSSSASATSSSTSSSTSFSSRASTRSSSATATATAAASGTSAADASASSASSPTTSSVPMQVILPAAIISFMVALALGLLAFCCLRRRRRQRHRRPGKTFPVITRADSISSQANFFQRDDEPKTYAPDRTSGWSRYWSMNGSTHYPEMGTSPPSGSEKSALARESWIGLPERSHDKETRGAQQRGYSACVEPLVDPSALHPTPPRAVEVPPGDEAKKIWRQIDSNYNSNGLAPPGSAHASDQPQHSWMAI